VSFPFPVPNVEGVYRIKMADSDCLVLCAPLCFLVNRFNRLELNVLKTCLKEWFTPADITKAKQQLIADAEKILLTVKAPRFPKRLDNEHKQSREVDDILSLLEFIDQNKSVSQLPRYVADNPDAMPSFRVIDGEFKFLLNKFDKMEALLEALHDQMSLLVVSESVYTGAINNSAYGPVRAVTVSDGKTLYKPTAIANGNDAGYTWTLSSHDSSAVTRQPTDTAIHTSSQHGTFILPGGPVPQNNDVHFPPLGKPEVTIDPSMNKALFGARSKTVWSEAAGLSSADSHDNGNDGFSIFESRRKRRRIRSQIMTQEKRSELQTGDVDSDINPLQGKNASNASTGTFKQMRPKKAPLIIGKRQQSENTPGLLAAKPLRKSIFCIDNINVAYSEVEVVKFVENMSVAVLSCHEVKPRVSAYQRRTGVEVTDRRAFRLCIYAKDRGLLLDAAKWPANVSISDWFFKTSTDRTTTATTLKTASPPVQPQPIDQGDSAGIEPDADGGEPISITQNSHSDDQQQFLTPTDQQSTVPVLAADGCADNMDTTINYEYGVDK
jgi:hypothetical protein